MYIYYVRVKNFIAHFVVAHIDFMTAGAELCRKMCDLLDTEAYAMQNQSNYLHL